MSDMQCRQFREMLAYYRELAPAQRERLDAHVASCAECARALKAYQRQDALLRELPGLEPSVALREAVRLQTVGGRRRLLVSRAPRWAQSLAMAMVALLVVLGGTARVAAGSLPGEPLYAIKRIVERARLQVTVSDTARETYRQELADTRRAEVREVIDLQLSAPVEFAGRLDGIEGDTWVIDGVPLQVGPGAFAEAPPVVGSVVQVLGEAADGNVRAQVVVVERTPTAAPPTQIPVSPSATPGDTLAPTVATPTPPKPTPTPVPTRRRTSRIPSPSTMPEIGATAQAALPTLTALLDDAEPVIERTRWAVETRNALRATHKPTANGAIATLKATLLATSHAGKATPTPTMGDDTSGNAATHTPKAPNVPEATPTTKHDAIAATVTAVKTRIAERTRTVTRPTAVATAIAGLTKEAEAATAQPTVAPTAAATARPTAAHAVPTAPSPVPTAAATAAPTKPPTPPPTRPPPTDEPASEQPTQAPAATPDAGVVETPAANAPTDAPRIRTARPDNRPTPRHGDGSSRP